MRFQLTNYSSGFTSVTISLLYQILFNNHFISSDFIEQLPHFPGSVHYYWGKTANTTSKAILERSMKQCNHFDGV